MGTYKKFEIKKEILKGYRKSRGHTQESLAKEVKKTAYGIKTIEKTGRTSPGTAIELARALDITLETLTGKDQPILTNFWLQTARGDNGFSNLGTLYETHSSMLMNIQKEIERDLPNILGVDFETTAKVSTDSVITTLGFASTNEDFQNISYKFSKVSIIPEKGIFISKLISFEDEINNIDIKSLLSNTTTSYDFNNTSVGADAYYKISIFIKTSDSEHPAEEAGFKQLDQGVFKSLDECRGIIHAFINNYNPLSVVPWEFDNPVQIVCTQANGEVIVITLSRLYKSSEGQEENAPFPTNWKSLYVSNYKHKLGLKGSELIRLADFDRGPIPSNEVDCHGKDTLFIDGTMMWPS